MSVAETVDDDLVRSLRTGVAEELSVTARRISADGRRLEGADEEMLARQLIAQRLEQLASDSIADGSPVLSQSEEATLAEAVCNRLFHLGRLQPLLDDESIQNVVANGYDRVFVEYAGGLAVNLLWGRVPKSAVTS